MTLVLVDSFWVNPDKVVGCWVRQIAAYRDEPTRWAVVLRCDEGQVWEWKFDTEEDASTKCDQVAAQVNAARGNLR